MLADLAFDLRFGLMAAAIVVLARAAPIWPRAWLTRKPLKCAICCAFWGSTVLAACVAWLEPAQRGRLGAAWLCGIVVGAVVHRFLFPPPVELV